MTREQFWVGFIELAKELSCRKLAQILKVSASTAARWKAKRGSPPRAMRSFVIDELKKRKAKVSDAETGNPEPETESSCLE